MKIQDFTLYTFKIPLNSGSIRSGGLIELIADGEKRAWGEIAPLPGWSRENLQEALHQLKKNKKAVVDTDWQAGSLPRQSASLNLFPSAAFGLESALLTFVSPLAKHQVATSALLMGTKENILKQASERLTERFTSAKLKVSNLTFQEAKELITYLKDKIRLRIDVNRAWETEESLRFFAQFSQDAFDYVEEPFADPRDLGRFSHSLAVDESFLHDLSFKQLENLPKLKALIYKPTLHGGLENIMQVLEWARARHIKVVLSSSFESDLGLASIASLAYRFSLFTPVGIGTYHYLKNPLCAPALQFSDSLVEIPSHFSPNKEMLDLYA